MWSITWRRWSFPSPHLNVGQFSNTSFLKPIVTSGKLKELISPHCLQIKYLYFTCNCFHLWLLAITEGKTWEQRSLLLHRETECKQLQMHERRNWHLPQWNCGKKLAKDWGILPGSLKAQFNLFIDSFTKTKYRLHRWNNYIFFFYQKGKRNLGGNEWYYRREILPVTAWKLEENTAIACNLFYCHNSFSFNSNAATCRGSNNDWIKVIWSIWLYKQDKN